MHFTVFSGHFSFVFPIVKIESCISKPSKLLLILLVGFLLYFIVLFFLLKFQIQLKAFFFHSLSSFFCLLFGISGEIYLRCQLFWYLLSLNNFVRSYLFDLLYFLYTLSFPVLYHPSCTFTYFDLVFDFLKFCRASCSFINLVKCFFYLFLLYLLLCFAVTISSLFCFIFYNLYCFVLCQLF